jgi:hypothetical protein
MSLWRIKLKAFSIHLVLSALVITLCWLIVTQFWYPDALFKLENVWQGLEILIPVDAILGPILTLILFVPGKKGLKLDLSIIAALQVGALLYGGILIYKQRPIALAFVIDRFETVLASEDYVGDILLNRFKKEEQQTPLMTYVLPPQSNEERTHFLLNKINIKKIGERHFPLLENIDHLIDASIKRDSLVHMNEKEQKILSEFMLQNKSSKGLLLFPVQASTYESIILVLNTKTGTIKQYLEISPWKQLKKRD